MHDKNTIELCIAKYGFYHEKLELAISEKKSTDVVEHNKEITTTKRLFTNIVIKVCSPNYQLIMKHHPDFAKYKFQFSTFSLKQMVNGEPITDVLFDRIASMLSTILKGVDVKAKDVYAPLGQVCEESKFNEAKDWFEALPPTNTNHIDNWLIKYFGAQNNELNKIIGKKWLMSAVARAHNPGTYVEGCLVMHGGQRAGKTYGMISIAPTRNMHAAINSDLGDLKKMAELCRGKVIVEFGELGCLRNSELEATKDFLTKQHIDYRACYARETEQKPLSPVFCGNTNDFTFLSDKTGNRRFWCVKISTFDVESFLRDKVALWREAYDLYKEAMKLKTDDEQVKTWIMSTDEHKMLEKYNSGLMIIDPIEHFIERMLEARMFVPGNSASDPIFVPWVAEQFRNERGIAWRDVPKAFARLGYSSPIPTWNKDKQKTERAFLPQNIDNDKNTANNNTWTNNVVSLVSNKN